MVERGSASGGAEHTGGVDLENCLIGFDSDGDGLDSKLSHKSILAIYGNSERSCCFEVGRSSGKRAGSVCCGVRPLRFEVHRVSFGVSVENCGSVSTVASKA